MVNGHFGQHGHGRQYGHGQRRGNCQYRTLSVLNSIVAGNMVMLGTITATTGPDVSGTISTGSSNLIGNGTGMTGLTNGTSHDQVGTSASPINPLLGPLANNGGTTEIMALLTGSPAINAGGTLTTLTSAITSSITSIAVVTGSTIASTPGSYVIQVDSEEMLVTNVTGNTLAVVRGYNGTTAASHSTNAIASLPTDQIGQLLRQSRHRCF